MKKIFTTACAIALSAVGAFAQTINPANYPLTSIDTLQFVSQAQLNLFNSPTPDCQDETLSRLGDTVKVRGIVAMKGDLAPYPTDVNRRNTIIFGDTTAFDAIEIFGFDPVLAGSAEVTDLEEGDSVEVTGVLSTFSGGTQVEPLFISLLDVGKPVFPRVLPNIGVLNDDNRINQLSTGEQWESHFARVENVTVTAVYFFGTNRASFDIEDAAGNVMNVSDRFRVQDGVGGVVNVGNGVTASVGDQFTSISGIVRHSRNGGGNCGNGRGYEINPFKTTHYIKSGIAAPSISNLNRIPIAPTSAQTVTVSADIIDADGIASATLYYAVGASATSYIQAPMALVTGNQYQGVIPALSNGSFVKYYVSATDNATPALTATFPNIVNGNPKFYIVRDNGLEIRDVQYTPFDDGNSGYEGLDVTVSGIVTASAEDLGTVFIQQEGATTWGGIQVLGSGPAFANLKTGEKATFTGQVVESFGFTQLINVTNVTNVTNSIVPDPIQINPNAFTNYSVTANEPYESMLVQLVIAGQKLVVVDTNADGPNQNFAEWRVGTDVFDPNSGSRVLVGRGGGTVNAPYINSNTEATNNLLAAGVTPQYVMPGDSFTAITGIAYYSFSNMKLLPRDSTDFNTVVIASLAKEVKGNKVNFDVFPNPAQNYVNIQANGYANTFDVAVYDISGRKVQGINAQQAQAQLNTADLPSGYYIMTISNSNEVIYRQKLSVVK